MVSWCSHQVAESKNITGGDLARDSRPHDVVAPEQAVVASADRFRGLCHSNSFALKLVAAGYSANIALFKSLLFESKKSNSRSLNRFRSEGFALAWHSCLGLLFVLAMEIPQDQGPRKLPEAQVAEWRQRLLESRRYKNKTPIRLYEHVLYVSGIITSFSLLAAGAMWLAGHWTSLHPDWYLPFLLALAGIYLADLFSGLLHWTFDTWFDENTPFLRMVIPVREHHIFPQRILKVTFYENIGIASWQSAVLTGPGILILFLLVSSPSIVHFSVMIVLMVATTGLLLMFVLHQQAHNFTAPHWVRILRRTRLILEPRKHLSGHHHGSHDQDYCLINGWVDKTLGKVGFWRVLEWLVCALTGSIPRRDDEVWLLQFHRGARPFPSHQMKRCHRLRNVSSLTETRGE